MALIDKLIKGARADGSMYQSYVDRMIDSDEYAQRDESNTLGRSRSAASVAGSAFSEYYKAAQSDPKHSGDYQHQENAESPIESALAFSLTKFSNVRVEPKRAFSISDAVKAALASKESVQLFQQVWVSQYRLDFLITCRVGDVVKLLAIEADGHQFHNKDLDQVIRDNRRTSVLARDEIFVIRFTGREIYYEIESCVSTVQSILKSWGAATLG